MWALSDGLRTEHLELHKELRDSGCVRYVQTFYRLWQQLHEHISWNGFHLDRVLCPLFAQYLFDDLDATKPGSFVAAVSATTVWIWYRRFRVLFCCLVTDMHVFRKFHGSSFLVASSWVVTSSPTCPVTPYTPISSQVFSRGSHDDATRKLLSWNLSLNSWSTCSKQASWRETGPGGRRLHRGDRCIWPRSHIAFSISHRVTQRANRQFSTYVTYSMARYITPVQTSYRPYSFKSQVTSTEPLMLVWNALLLVGRTRSRVSTCVICQSVGQAKFLWKCHRRTVDCRKSDCRYRSPDNV